MVRIFFEYVLVVVAVSIGMVLPAVLGAAFHPAWLLLYFFTIPALFTIATKIFG